MRIIYSYASPRLRVYIVQGSTGLHTVICADELRLCSCPAFHYRRDCKHVKLCGVNKLALEIDKLVEESVSTRRVFTSSLAAINELFGGEPYASDTIFMVFALPNVGKTLLMLQEAVWFEAQGLNVLIVDTEGSLGSFAKKWLPVLRARFKDVSGKKKGKIYGVVRKGIESVAEFFGWKVGLEMKGSKIELVYKDKIKDSKVEAWNTLKEKKIDVLIMDSVTMPIRRIPSSPQNLPVKSDLEGFIMGQLMLAQDKFNVAVLATSHASVNPTNPYDTSADLRGGLAIKHTAKHVMYIEWRKKKGLENIRQFWLVRRPDAEPWSMVRFARIDDMGYHDVSVDERELGEYLTNSQLKRLQR